MYKGFERFWHWSQTTIITSLIFTGLEVHGVFKLLGFQNAVLIHNILAWLLVILVCFAIFWHFTTGEWKQYVPTTAKLIAVARYYGYGIFRGEAHPAEADKSILNKLNPLQRIAYLQLKVLIIPAQLISGFLYYFYNEWGTIGAFLGINIGSFLTLEIVAIVHTLCAYALAMFIVIHVYLTTTGHTPLAHIQAMITGYEEHDEHGGHGH